MTRMRFIWIAALAALGVQAAPVREPAPAPRPPALRQPPPAQEEEGVIDPRADDALKKMSAYLTKLQSVRVDARTIDEKVTTEGQKIQELQQSTVTLQRPARLRVDRFGPNGHATLRSDGREVVLFNRDKNVFASTTVPPTLDAALDDLRARLHIDAPGADFLFSDPYKELTDGLMVGHYVGLEPVGEVMAHHLAVTMKDTDWQIWIQDGAQPLPLRYVVTSKDMPGHPQFTLELTNWQVGAVVPPETFTVNPPAGAKRIEIERPAPQPAKP